MYFNENTYDFNYPLFKTSSENQDNVLKIPDKTTNAGFIEWINTLPNVESPEWSGLPNNAEKLVFFHFDPAYNDDKLDELSSVYSKENAVMAQEGLEVDIL